MINVQEEEATKRNAAITALHERTGALLEELANLSSSMLYLWLISLGRYYDKNMREWVVDMYPH